jgi:hypothetical protein
MPLEQYILEYATLAQVIYLQNVMAAMQQIFFSFRFDDNNKQTVRAVHVKCGTEMEGSHVHSLHEIQFVRHVK